MSTQRYYRIATSTALAAAQKFEAEKEQLCRAARAFAAHFGGIPVYTYTSYSFGFYGLRFATEKPRTLWTVPDEKGSRIQTPRGRLKSPIDKSLKEPHKALLADWDAKYAECFPSSRSVDRRDLNEAIGYHDGMAILCGDSFLSFAHDGQVWVTTRLELTAEKVEITGSEFEQARKAAEKAQQAA